ncbi:unnamed protein product [Microthlaspi erraticum]|uniref:Reverse transcriptase/retrotransposon-derived protein RNase H-like domain-containing protein n=1 Tax=Microthlaspi erraticum TaxID=1685480 RepID=A0A6D2I0H3_9BRAS|nr:unnamed protein product [Microthlaspi erraticum]
MGLFLALSPLAVVRVRHLRGFYRRFIKDFSKITRPLTLLCKEVKFDFDSTCLEAFHTIKGALVSAPIVQPPDWSLPFEVMTDASDYAVGAVLGQRKEKKLHVIYYASRTLDEAQCKYATTEKELLAVVFAFEKFRSYLVGSKEFDLEIKDKKGIDNGVADHLSRMKIDDDVPLDDSLPDEHVYAVEVIDYGSLMMEFDRVHEGDRSNGDDGDRALSCNAVNRSSFPWFGEIANYLAAEHEPTGFVGNKKKKRCVADEEIPGILFHCHSSSYAGHFATYKTVSKALQAGYWWPTMFRDAHRFVSKCDVCQRQGNISKRNEMPQNFILEVEVFDVWGVDFMGPFPSSYGNLYILVAAHGDPQVYQQGTWSTYQGTPRRLSWVGTLCIPVAWPQNTASGSRSSQDRKERTRRSYGQSALTRQIFLDRSSS